ncbi:MAG: terminase small subunit [Clostridiales bacterium]
MALTAKQKIFCDEYLIDLNATQAAIRAGYSPKTAQEQGSRLLLNVMVQGYIEKRMAEKESQLIASQDEVLQTLTRVMRREEKEIIVVTCKERKSYYDENGKKVIVEKEAPQLVEIPTKVCDLNKAAELIGKRYSLFTDNLNTTGNVNIKFVEDLQDG